MNNAFPIEILPAKGIGTVLAMDWDQLTGDQARAVEDFIVRIGGIENATLAVDLLSEMECFEA